MKDFRLFVKKDLTPPPPLPIPQKPKELPPKKILSIEEEKKTFDI